MEKGITKEHSKILQGLAILMMLYHHLFSTPEALGIPYYSVLGSYFELHLAWFFKMCVAVYAFVSGYGLCRTLMNNNPQSKDEKFLLSLLKDYKLTISQLKSFYLKYWLCFLIFVPVAFIFYNRPFELKEFILNFLGLSSSYNGAWWYIFFYVKMLFILPLINQLFVFRRKDITQIIFYLFLFGLILALRFFSPAVFNIIVDFFQPAFFLCFLMGYIISKLQVYELCYKILPKYILYFLSVLGFILCIWVRMHIAKDASSAGLDFIFVPVFSYGFLIIVNMVKFLTKFFLFLGKYSTYMWLTHVFFYDTYAKKIVMASHISTFIYLSLIIMSLTSAFILELVYAKIKCYISNKRG